MTYCVSVATKDGLVFCSDSRTNAGPDMLSTYSKMHIYELGADRLVVLLSAGNLATTQAVIGQIDADLDSGDGTSLRSCKKMTDVARYVGEVSRQQQKMVEETTGDSDINVSASFVVGGQVGAAQPTIYMVYPEGNYISTSDETSYLQIGESKYGKPILDRILNPETSLDDAARCALVSMDSTLRANATVGPPLEVLVIPKDSYSAKNYVKLSAEDPYLLSLRKAWNDAIQAAFKGLPAFRWEKAELPTLTAITDNTRSRPDQ